MAQRKKERKHPWRENLETLAGAVVLALLFKAFVLEISRIPSPSMQPTLMGMPEAGVSDRVLVDKFSFAYRDPARWEIVVFRHPIERSRNMVKRLVGVGGEELRIEHGDLWTRRSEDEPWSIPRRPRAVQEEMWRALDRDDPQLSSWRVVDGGLSWRLAKRDVEARGDGRIRFRSERATISNGYYDGYPDALRAPGGAQFTSHAVGDLRIQGEVSALPGCREVVAILREGDRTYRYVLPGPAAAEDATPRIEVLDEGETVLASVEGEPLRLRAGSAVEVGFQNLDDRLSLELDGEWLVELDVEPVAQQDSSVELAVTGDGADLADLQVLRDVYYRQGLTRGASTPIPDGHFFMLGDNTQASADSREWVAVTYAWTDAAGERHEVTGNWRPEGENPAPGRDGGRFLRDEWGERHRLPDDAQELGRVRRATVPRELVRGRALAVFWPFKPSLGLWRLSWLH